MLQPGPEELQIADMPDPAVAAARVVGDFPDGARERCHQRPCSGQVRSFFGAIVRGVSKDAVEVDRRVEPLGEGKDEVSEQNVVHLP